MQSPIGDCTGVSERVIWQLTQQQDLTGYAMTLEPLWNDGPLIAGHALVALAGIVLGGIQLALPKGTPFHRALGYVWMSAMAYVATSSFWIHNLQWFGPFSAIHLLSLLVLHTLVFSIVAARRGKIKAHRIAMIQLYVFGLILTGAFTLIPGRTMHAVVFGG